LVPNSIILNDIKGQNGVFMDFFGDFGLKDISIANCAKITRDKLGQPAFNI